MPRLDAATRNMAIGRLQAGETQSSVARRLNVSQSTISRLVTRFQQTAILQPHLLPAIDVQREIFQQDNARPHTARVTRDFLAANNVNVLPWPSRFPDLNHIEHLWDELDRRLRQRQRQPQTLQALAACLQEEWQRIPQAFIRRLIQSMTRRVRTVIHARGGHNRY